MPLNLKKLTMAVKKTYIWVLFLISLVFNAAYSQTFDFTLGSDEICQGSTIELTVIDIVPVPSPTFYYNWSISRPSDTDGFPDQLFDNDSCLLYTSPSPRDLSTSRMPSSA